MSKHLRAGFEDKTVILDGEEFEDCTFVECKLIYRGGEPPRLSNNKFHGCTWELEDAALRTISFLVVLNISEGRAFVDGIINTIRGITEFLEDGPEGPTH